MRQRNIDPTMDLTIVEQIDDRLKNVQEEHNVTLLLAIESGSRAWGFPSPDSDYDCRFIYMRPYDEYVTPWPRRNVIETPLDAIFDVNGWDIGKAVQLLAGGNAVVLEWLTSPIVYYADSAFKQAFSELAEDVVERSAIAYHYVCLGRSMLKRLTADPMQVKQKKIFYALRPAMALRWLMLHEDDVITPMNFLTLMEQAEISQSLRMEIQDLLQKKAQTRELGVAPLSSSIASFIEEELSRAEQVFPARVRARNSVVNEKAEAFFRQIIRDQKRQRL